ncbi:MAG: hypothetical protein Q8O76_14125 [Chloroflexota bacterium]|nr:hypothetical protein [Chloroflexota bacterium]
MYNHQRRAPWWEYFIRGLRQSIRLLGAGEILRREEKVPRGAILYFERSELENTALVIDAVRARAKALGIRFVIVASNSGETALKFWTAVQGLGVKLICVSKHTGFGGGDEIALSQEGRRELEATDIAELICSHALSGVGRSITQKFGRA